MKGGPQSGGPAWPGCSPPVPTPAPRCGARCPRGASALRWSKVVLFEARMAASPGGPCSVLVCRRYTGH